MHHCLVNGHKIMSSGSVPLKHPPRTVRKMSRSSCLFFKKSLQFSDRPCTKQTNAQMHCLFWCILFSVRVVHSLLPPVHQFLLNQGRYSLWILPDIVHDARPTLGAPQGNRWLPLVHPWGSRVESPIWSPLMGEDCLRGRSRVHDACRQSRHGCRCHTTWACQHHHDGHFPYPRGGRRPAHNATTVNPLEHSVQIRCSKRPLEPKYEQVKGSLPGR